MNHQRLRDQLQQVRERIAQAAARSGRSADSVTLVAVVKRIPADWVRALAAEGVRDFAENYPQELWAKTEALADLSSARWHLIGHLQTNKAKRVLPLVRFIHSVDSLKLLRLLNDWAATASDPPQVCLQVNTSEESAKHGWSPSALENDADAIAGCRAIPIVGLMTMAALGTDAETARPSFARLRLLRDQLQARTGRALPELSMGMSGDFETAIEEGATWVRVGSALFEGTE